MILLKNIISEIKNIPGSHIKLLSFDGKRWYDDVDKVDMFLQRHFRGVSEEIINHFKKTGMFYSLAHDAEFDLKMEPNIEAVIEVDKYMQDTLLKKFGSFLRMNFKNPNDEID